MGQLLHEFRKFRFRSVDGCCQFFNLRNALRRNNTEFSQMTPQCINQLRALPDQHIARAVRHGLGLLRLGFHCNKPHCRT